MKKIKKDKIINNMNEMTLIAENNLTEYIKNNVVQKIWISQNKDATYRLFINLTWKEEKICLGTSRRKPRHFVSLDRLISFLKKLGVRCPIELLLLHQENQHDEIPQI
ncbi:hypothetical protein [Janthinobacterium sp. FW305-128]|uniref:hypothetical protein n=1 Tax=Janthinobacterium sp. FW305-128 TaxID=2775055 RepID=UPI001E6256C7|nr:hypothetical protein [Janthinobacterium sp. FW305-128]MCC7684729.1 hypothetical protein [Janthinobacterium sp. FW305-128]